MKSNIVINPVLVATATMYAASADQYVAKKLFPVFPAGQQAAGFFKFDAENMLNIPQLLRRAPGTPYSRGRTQASNDTYNTNDYGHEEAVDDRERKKYAVAFDADNAAVRRATRVVLVNQEVRAHALATSNDVPHSNVSVKWDQSTAEPAADVKAAMEVIRINCGMDANTLLLTQPVIKVLEEHPKILDRIKYSQRGVVTIELLAQVFGVDQIIVAKTVANSANEGQVLTPADIWGDDAILAYVDSSPDLGMPTFGRIFSWTQEVGPEGIIVESYREDPTRGDVHRVRNDADEKLVAPAAGYRLGDLLT
jgi:hypothetical protein